MIYEKKFLEKTKDEDQLFLYEDTDETEAEKAKTIELILFSLDDGWYAIDIKDVYEILNDFAATKIPGMPDYILGAANVRGNIISVTDLRRLFNLGKTRLNNTGSIIIARAAGKTTGLLVDAVSKISGIILDSMQPVLSTIPDVDTNYIKGEIKLLDNRLITVIDFERIITSERMQFE